MFLTHVGNKFLNGSYAVTVAAANSIHAPYADFVCTGVDDHITLQAAHDFAAQNVTVHGSVIILLLDADFYVGGTTKIRHARCTIKGGSLGGTWIHAQSDMTGPFFAFEKNEADEEALLLISERDNAIAALNAEMAKAAAERDRATLDSLFSQLLTGEFEI